VLRRGSCPGRETTPTGGPPLSVSGVEEACTVSVQLDLGPWAPSETRPNGVPSAFFYFFYSFSFF
jgi:hypothetical protein